MICLLSMFQYIILEREKLTSIYSLHVFKYKDVNDIVDYIIEYRNNTKWPVFNCDINLLLVLRENEIGLSMLSNYIHSRKFTMSKNIFIPKIFSNRDNLICGGFVCEFYEELMLTNCGLLNIDDDNVVLSMINSSKLRLEKLMLNLKKRILYVYKTHINRVKKISEDITLSIIKEDSLEMEMYLENNIARHAGDMPFVISVSKVLPAPTS